ncbi:MAG TPA: methyltransferase [Polyangiales bacterium]|nr:methyltransferase [Polyangiales bacterium]
MKSRQKRGGGGPARGRDQARGAVLEGRVRDVTDAGDAVVETSEGVVLASGGLPDEQVRVRVTGSRSGVLHGSVLSILTPSPSRIEPACSLTERCGGCPLMSLTLDGQHALKARRVAHALNGLGAPELSVTLESHGPIIAYRRRARLAFRKLGSGLVLGYRVHGQNQLVDVQRCPVLTPPLQAALTQVREQLAGVLIGAGEIDLDSASDSEVQVAIRCESTLDPAAYGAAERLAAQPPITGVALSVAGGAPARYGVMDAPRLDPDGLPLVSKAHGFSQVNAAVNARLRELVIELAEPRDSRVLELYAGHGNFTLGLAAQAQRILAVEGDTAAVESCRTNLRARDRTQAQVISTDVRTLQLKDRFDVVVLDPPRGGCPSLAALVQAARPRRVVYVSCHMTTLSRDLRALHAEGFTLDRAHALDMFPQTGHVEAIVRMVRAAN